MALEVLGGAALGAVSAESLKALLDFKNRTIKFDKYLKELEQSVNRMEKSVGDIKEKSVGDRESNLQNEITKMITDELKEPRELISKCQKSQRWNLFEKASNSKKLKKKVGKLNILQTYMPIIIGQNIFTFKIQAKLEKMMEGGPVSGPNEFVDPCGAPEVEDSTVGLDENMEGEPICVAPEVVDFTVGSDEMEKAGLGAAFDELLKAVVECKSKAINFKSILERLESRLHSIRPTVGEIENLNENVLEEEIKIFTHQLKEGTKLVRKCSKIKPWNILKKASYSTKIEELEESLGKFFLTSVQALQTRDSKKILVKLDEIWPEFIVGLDESLEELKMRLLKDGVQVVVLSAPGGCGKTTLAKMLCHDAEIKGVFRDNIFFVTVSKSPNIKDIVQTMFRHSDFPVPVFQSEDDAINQLEILLKQIGPGPILLVLDDVWPGSESLIHKFMLQIPEYKILVTSRSEFPIFNSTYKLEPLNDQDAMALFRYSSFSQGGSINIPDDLVQKMVRLCRGSPLALRTVGRSLRGKPEVIWRRTLKELSEERPSIFNSLKTIVDALDENVKECFLDLGSFPEDQRIPITALMDMWVELYNLDEDGVYAIIYELASRSFVYLAFTRKDPSEFDGYYNEHFVTQHDVLRDMAIYLSSQNPIEERKRLIMDIRGNDLSEWSNEQIQPFHARLSSISTGKTFSSSWYNIQLPEIEVLILNFTTRNYSLPKFMEEMDHLKVLIITNYGFCPTELSNFQLLGHLSSLKRIRLDHVSISFLSDSTLQFRNLLKISLIMCKFRKTFWNCTVDFAYMFPNLVEIDIHCCSDLLELPEGLCDIVCLKKLSVTKCNVLDALPQRLGSLTNLELLRLHSCTGLMGLPESVGSLHKLRFLDISDCLCISELPIRIGELYGLEKLDMRGCGLHQLPPSVKDLGQLKDVICDEDTVHLWEPFKIHLNNLKPTVLKKTQI